MQLVLSRLSIAGLSDPCTVESDPWGWYVTVNCKLLTANFIGICHSMYVFTINIIFET